jgi:tRNA nucleotidyltransferase (CCA-adding enzyme)
VGDPDRRFDEDALRILRGLRLAAQLEFDIHPGTADAIHRHAGDLRHVAQERIWAEFSRLLCSPGAEKILLEFSDVVCRIIPELGPCVGFDQRNFHHCYDVYTHSVKALSNTPPLLPLRLAALLHDVGKPDTFSLDEEGTGHFYGHPAVSTILADAALRRLRVSNELRQDVLLLIERHDLPVLPDRRWVGRWLARLGEENFFLLLALKRADRAACADPTPASPDPLEQAEALARALLEEQTCLSLKDLCVKGNDCLALGLKGKEIGSALQMLLDRVAEGLLPNEREILLVELKKYAES